MMNIVWAYNPVDVDGNGQFGPHTPQNRGGMPYTFIQDTNGGGDGGDGDGNGNGDGGNGSSSLYTPAIFGILALFLFQRVIGA